MAALIEPQSFDEPAEVASRIMRRAHVSKITRALRDLLTLANIKVKLSWEKYSIDILEPKIELEIKRQRSSSFKGALPDASSSVSAHGRSHRRLNSSLMNDFKCSDDLPRADHGHGSRKRVRYQAPSSAPAHLTCSDHMMAQVEDVHHEVDANGNWKNNYYFPEPGDAYHNRDIQYNDLDTPKLLFVSETSTSVDRSPSPRPEQDDEHLPVMGFHAYARGYPQNNIILIPGRIPCTRSSDVACSTRIGRKLFIDNATNRDDVSSSKDPVMSLVTPPSPAMPKHTRTRPDSPQYTPFTLPAEARLSSMIDHHGGGSDTSLLGFDASTPAPSFKFCDYINVTPSPAQATCQTPGGIEETPPMV